MFSIIDLICSRFPILLMDNMLEDSKNTFYFIVIYHCRFLGTSICALPLTLPTLSIPLALILSHFSRKIHRRSRSRRFGMAVDRNGDFNQDPLDSRALSASLDAL